MSASPSRVVLRSMRRGHVEQLVALEAKAFRSFYRPHRFTEKDFLRYLERDNTIALVAVKPGNVVVGYVLGVAPTTRYRQAARLDSIAVARAWRARNIGQRLLRRFLRVAHTRGCRYVSLEVAEQNAPARRLFGEAAFRRLRRLPRYYSASTDALRLRATL